MSLTPGQSLSSYEILGLVGAGAMGEVYRARDTRLGREVAVKVLPEHFAADEERLRRFEREAKALASLNHPNVAQIFGVDQVDDTCFLVLEFVPGETLEDRLARGPLPVDEVVEVCGQIAEGLAAAHEAGVIHRDLKPANVRLTPDGTVKVLDFGLAKPDAAGGARGSATGGSGGPGDAVAMTDSVLSTEGGRLLGTPTYMSPEQARGRPVDRRVDVWAFGCVLYECLTGERAFSGDTLSDVLAAVLEREADLSRLPAATPAHVRRLLRRCLAKDPRRRLRDVGDAGLLLAERSPDSADDGAAGRRGPAAVWWVATLLVAGAALVAGRALRPEPAPPSPPRVTQLTFSGDDRQPDVSPDGRLIAFSSGRTGTSRIWLRQVLGGGEQPLTDGPDWRPHFTPDGEAVTFIRTRGGASSAYRVPVVGGPARPLLDDVHEVVTSPDGRRLAYLRGGAGGADLTCEVGVLDLETGEERLLTETVGWELLGLSWSPDGERVAVTRLGIQGGSSEARTLLVDAGTGEVRLIDVTGGLGSMSGAAWAGPTALVHALAPVGVSGTTAPGPIVRYDLATGERRDLLWMSNLFPFRGSLNTTTQLSLLDDDALVFDAFVQTQALHEVVLGEDAAPPVARRLLGGISTNRQPAYHPDGDRVLFTSNRAGNVDLFSYALADGALVQLTVHAGSDWDGAYTPDGRSLLWGSNRSGDLELWIAEADGSRARQITRGGRAENPTMTRDGEWIVYSSSLAPTLGIFRCRPDGSEVTPVLEGNWVNPEVSPDGRHVLCVAVDTALLSNTIVVAEVMTGRLTAFEVPIDYGVLDPNVTYGRGRWMPDGAAIVFLGIDGQGRTGLWVQEFRPDEDTSATRRPLVGFDGALVHESFGISPDGRRIAVSSLENSSMLMLADRLPALR